MSTPTLFTLFTVHCFWGKCGHTVQDADTHAASRRMQAHYDAVHGDDLTALGYPPRKPQPPAVGHQFDGERLETVPSTEVAYDSPKPGERHTQ